MNAITDKKAQAAIDKRQEGRALQHQRDLVVVLSTVEGRRVLWHIIDDLAGLNGFSNTADNSVFLSEGRRSVGGRLMLELQAASTELSVTMVSEAIRGGVIQQQLMQGGEIAQGENNGG